MLEYKLKNNCVSANTDTPMEDYLRSLGIEKVESFIHSPSKDDELSPWLLNNMNKCVEELHKGFTQNKKFFLQVDSDVDGITSSTIFYRFFKEYYPEASITWRLHDGKEHGVILSTVPQDCDYVILPDSGSMQLEEQQKLAELGKIVIVLDHHQISSGIDNSNIIVINNQNSVNFSNKSLSGAGVVFKLVQAYGEEYPHMYCKYNKFYDLAALGILSDMMDVRDLDNNYIIYQGLGNVTNDMFTALLNQQAYSISDILHPNKIDVVFYISPLINGVIRAGTTEEKEILFRGFIGEPGQEFIDTEYRGTSRHESFYQYAARIAYNIKNRQNTQKEKCFEFLKNKIDTEYLNDNKIISVIVSKDDKVPVPQNITGLIAMELLKYYNKPTLVLRPKITDGELTYSGSGRGRQLEGFSSFLQFVRDSDASEYAEGHSMAFGTCIRASEYDNFIQECNSKLQDINFNNDYIEVDAIFTNTVNHKMLFEFAKYNYIYGNSIPQPRIAIEGTLSPDNVKIMGKDNTSVRITIDKLPCVRFKDKKLVDELVQYEAAKFKLIGRTQINTWMGKESAQLIIDAIELEPVAAIKPQSLF